MSDHINSSADVCDYEFVEIVRSTIWLLYAESQHMQVAFLPIRHASSYRK